MNLSLSGEISPSRVTLICFLTNRNLISCRKPQKGLESAILCVYVCVWGEGEPRHPILTFAMDLPRLTLYRYSLLLNRLSTNQAFPKRFRPNVKKGWNKRDGYLFCHAHPRKSEFPNPKTRVVNFFRFTSISRSIFFLLDCVFSSFLRSTPSRGKFTGFYLSVNWKWNMFNAREFFLVIIQKKWRRYEFSITFYRNFSAFVIYLIAFQYIRCFKKIHSNKLNILIL